MPTPSPLLMPRRRAAVPSVQDFAAALPRLAAELEGLGVEVSADTLRVAAQAIEPVRLGDLLQPSVGAGLIGPAWRRVLDREDYPLIAVALAVEVLDRSPAAAARSLSAVRKHYDRTLAFARAMYGIRVYEHAREMSARQLEYGRRAYMVSARVFARALSADELLSAETLKLVKGMYAVATLVLSRNLPVTVAELSLARDHLKASVELGNRGPEAAAYLAELHLRLYDRSQGPLELEEGLAVATAEDGRAGDSASLRLTACELGLRLLQRTGDPGGAVLGRVAADLAKARRFGGLDDHDRVRLELLSNIVAAHQRPASPQDVLRQLDLRGAPLPFGLRTRLTRMHRRRSPQFLPLLLAVTQSLQRLSEEESAPRLALEMLAALKSLEARSVGGERPLEGAAALRQGIDARLRALDGSRATRMGLYRLASEYRDLFRLTADVPAAVAAAERFAEAGAVDASWPVPLVELAQLAAEEPVASALAGRDDPLLARVARQDAEGLFMLAAERSLNNREFEHRVLGGRSDAYVVQDAHGLLASALVFKPMSTLQATRERATAIGLGQVLSDAGLQDRFSCIRSLAIVPLQPGDPRRAGQVDCVHVLGREDGTSLAELALRAARRGSAVDDNALGDVLDLLAVFHASSAPEGAAARIAARREWRTSLRTWLRSLVGNELALVLRDGWERSLPAGLPVFSKRDAHPGNWLVTTAGGVVALDLECATHLPMLLEVAQLIEDGPCLPADETGWAQRDAACHRYIAALRRHGADIPAGIDVRAAYEPFSAQRATLFLSRPEKWDPAQLRHARRVLTHLAARARSEDLRKYCSGVLSGSPEPTTEAAATAATPLTIDDDKRHQLSRSAAYLLRHHPEKAGLELDADGWATINGLIEALRPRLPWLDRQQLEAMVLHPDEKRYETRGGKIRALYGHSVPVSMPSGIAEVPEHLFHGTSWPNLGRILATGAGLQPMRRNAVHLSSDVATARTVGRRHGTPVVLGVRVADLAEAGIEVRRAADGVWLATSVPAPLLYVVDDQPR